MADVQLTVTIPSDAVARVTSAVHGLAGRALELQDTGTGTTMRVSYNEQQAGESAVEFAQRWLKTIGLSMIKLYELGTDRSRYSSEIASIALPQESVPADVLQ